ncbi:MAG: NAD(+) synthase [Cyclobacteriaceae bacterium]|nr:NAD(+) synthase [Cyclobacteriaceae bacterium]MCH8515604.1 NAD(+) synthase [Cyclobacteriaceae bacterium]
MKRKEILVGSASLNQTPIDWDNNTKNILSAISEAKKRSVALLNLPELCVTGYGCEDLFLSDWIYQSSIIEFQNILPHTLGIAVTINLPMIFEGRRYNCSALCSDGEVLGIYAKQNLAKDGVHYEPRWFDEWPVGKVESIKLGERTIPFGDPEFKIGDFRIGIEICEDAWRADQRPAHRLYQVRKVDIILNPSASHFSLSKTNSRERMILEVSSRYNKAYVFTNLIGNEAGRIIYDGESMVYLSGRRLASSPLLGFKNFYLTTATIDFDDYSNSKGGDDKQGLSKNEEINACLRLALFDYLRKSRSRGFVLSLSGGADSGMCAILVSEMLKKAIAELGMDDVKALFPFLRQDSDHVHELMHDLLTCAYQRTKNSSEATFQAAKAIATDIGATFYHWSIDDEVSSYTRKVEQAIGKKLNWDTDDITLQNIQARARSPIIWMLANKKNALLLTTSNRSEGDVGYTTMDGDTSGSIAPIAGLDKPAVRSYLKYAEAELSYNGLSLVNGLQPTAELRPGVNKQTDEDDLMPYEWMLKIERLAIGKYYSPLQVLENLQEERGSFSQNEILNFIIRFYSLWSRNQWKRERFAPSFHIDEFNTDPRSWFRFPILSSAYNRELDVLKQMCN